MALLTITRKQLADTRWSLLFSCLAFYGLAILWNWGISINQFPPPEVERDTAQASDRGDESVEPSGNDSEAAATDEPGPSDPGIDEADDESTPLAESDESEGDEENTEPRRTRPGRRRGTGIYVAFGVPGERMFNPEDPPTLLMQMAMANHPLVFLALIGWSIARGSASVAGEIERGSLDLTLSRPVLRSTYLSAQILTTLLVLALLTAAMMIGHVTSRFFFAFKNSPGLLEYWPSGLMMMGLGIAIYGYTLVFSSIDLVRARVGIIALGITLGGIAGIIFARQYEGYEWLENLSVFHFYWPVGIAAEWNQEQTRNVSVLLLMGLVTIVLSYLFFTRRDLPTNG